MTVGSTTLGERGDLGFGRSNLIISWALVVCALRRGTVTRSGCFPVVVKIKGKDLRAKKRNERMVRVDPKIRK